jgi:transcription initiation factor TFIIIB Brf1 subunit/transcription initiation factor TFIIB
MARSLKKLSTQCKDCGVVFDETLSNKQPKRALCKPCYIIEWESKVVQKKKYDRENRKTPNRNQLYFNYRDDNRKEFWRAINKEIRLTKNREEHLVFIAKQMDRILADETLMDYINHTTIIENKNKI